MKKESLIYGVAGLLAGVIVTVLSASYAVNNNQENMMSMMGIQKPSSTMSLSTGGHMSMQDMTGQLQSKTGDEFDRAFIDIMIVHHQGAIDMAAIAKTNAKHEEIKKMSGDIISAQTKEIEQMRQWQKDWGYGSGSTMPGMQH